MSLLFVVMLQSIESLILLPMDKDHSSLGVNSDSQHFIIVTNAGRYLPLVFRECFKYIV